MHRNGTQKCVFYCDHYKTRVLQCSKDFAPDKVQQTGTIVQDKHRKNPKKGESISSLTRLANVFHVTNIPSPADGSRQDGHMNKTRSKRSEKRKDACNVTFTVFFKMRIANGTYKSTDV